MYSEDQSQQLFNVLNTQYTDNGNNGNLEIEFRFGYYKGDTFVSDIGFPAFNRILAKYDKWEKSYISTKLSRSNDQGQSFRRNEITHENREPIIVYEKKEIIHFNQNLSSLLDNSEYGLRLAINHETDITEIFSGIGTDNQKTFNEALKFERVKHRHITIGPGYEIHLTEVESIDTNNLKNNKTSYELEIELTNAWKDNYNFIISTVLPELFCLVHNTEIVFSRSEHNNLINLCTKALVKDKSGNKDVYGYNHLPFNVIPTVVNLLYSHLVDGHIVNNNHTGYTVTDKAHGLNKLLIFHESGVWLVSPSTVPKNTSQVQNYPDQANLLSLYSPFRQLTIIQGEYIIYHKKGFEYKQPYVFWAYDCLYFNNVDIRSYPHLDPDATLNDIDNDIDIEAASSYSNDINSLGNGRCDKLRMIIDEFNDVKNDILSELDKEKYKLTELLSLNLKSHYGFVAPNQPGEKRDFFSVMRKVLELLPSRPYNTDGLIFTPVFTDYSGKYFVNNSGEHTQINSSLKIYKWKPLDELTVDLAIDVGLYDKITLTMLDAQMVPNDHYTNIVNSFKNFTVESNDIVKISYISEDRYSIEKIPNTPSAKLTSNQDLRLFPRQRTEIFGQILYINDNDYMVMFPNNSVRVPLPAIMDKKISNPEDISPLRTGHVFEISYNPETEEYTVNRDRPDKPLPNRKNVVFDNWNLIHNPITEEVLMGTSHRLRDKYFSSFKRELFKQAARDYPNGSLLDIGSGMGGTISVMSSFSKLFLVEPQLDHLPELLRRTLDFKKNNKTVDPVVGLYLWTGANYDTDFSRLRNRVLPSKEENVPHGLKTMLTEEEYSRIRLYTENDIVDPNIRTFIIQAGGQDHERITKLIQKINHGSVDVISSMLSMSFLWQNVNILAGFILTIVNNLAVNGSFIYTTIDGYAVRSLFVKGRTDVKFGSTSLSYDEKRDDLIINIPKSIVRNQREWLVNINHLIVGLGIFGCQLESSKKMNKEKFLSKAESGICQLYTSGKFIRKRLDNNDINVLISELQKCYALPVASENIDAVQVKINVTETNNNKPCGDATVFQVRPYSKRNVIYKLGITSIPVNEELFMSYAWKYSNQKNKLSVDTIEKLQEWFKSESGRDYMYNRKKLQPLMINNAVQEIRAQWYDFPLITIGSKYKDFWHALLLSSHAKYQNSNSDEEREYIVQDIINKIKSLKDITNKNLSDLCQILTQILGYDIYVLQAYSDDLELLVKSEDSSSDSIGSIFLIITDDDYYQSLGIRTPLGIQTIFPGDHSLIEATRNSIDSKINRNIQSAVASWNLKLR